MHTLPEIYARESILLTRMPDTVPVTIQALRIGDLGIVAIPCEVFVEIGLHLKAKSPLKPMFTIELANGYNGYLPTKAQHALGGYETWCCAFELSRSRRRRQDHGAGAGVAGGVEGGEAVRCVEFMRRNL